MPATPLNPIGRWLLVVITILSAGLAGAAEPAGKEKKHKFTNRLAKESSPYLLQHAHNPVDWYAWGPEAFARAKKDGKLIFLSIGYSSCHWCHVMERESFENEDVAKLLAKGFVCIKVDREERPDVDHIYMTALEAMNGRGGWPLSIFMTADGRPIVGGTYWPREDKEIEGEIIRGFKSIVKAIMEFHAKRPEDIEKQADQVAGQTRRALAGNILGKAIVDLDRGLVTAAIERLKERHDPDYGGFGSPMRKFQGTKFPTPPNLDLILVEERRTKSQELKEMLTLTLDHIIQGGIYDQAGGGFHRYSTERTWTVPHFEKMLYDNAQLVEIYARTYGRIKISAYRRAVQETLAFVERELSAPEGGFYSALDADSEGEEGKFYVWTPKEIDTVLGPDAELFKKVYGVGAAPNFEKKFHILTLPVSLSETAKKMKMSEEDLAARLAPMRKKILAARNQRPRPQLDTKILTAWNGQMIAGYALAGKVFEEPRYVARAAKAADFLLKNLRTKEGRLLRTYSMREGKGEARLNAYLDDYAFLIHGLLNLHDATGEEKWLTEARALADTMIRLFKDSDAGGFFYTSSDHEKLFARGKDQYDGAQPSGNSAAARGLVRLWIKTKEERYHVMARESFKAFAGSLKGEPGSLSTLCAALDEMLDAEAERK